MNLYAKLNYVNSSESINKARLKINASLQKVISAAYKDPYMLTNNVLCKNPLLSPLLDRVLGFREPTDKVNAASVLSDLLKYYRSNLKHFKLLLKKTEMFKKASRKPDLKAEEIYLIDVFAPVKKILNDGAFKDDNYLPGLYENLNSKNIKFIVLLTLYDDSNNINDLAKALEILRDEKNFDFIYGYEFLGFLDILKIALFALTYPIKLLALLSKKELFSDEVAAIAKDEMLRGVKQVRLYERARTLYAKKIEQKYGALNVLGWYEGQPHQKCFYRGLTKSHITGLVLYTYYDSYNFMEPLKSEVIFGVSPHKYLVASKGKLKNYDGFDVSLAPLLRSKRLFDLAENRRPLGESVVIFLPHETYIAQTIMDIVAKSDTLGISSVIVKRHPSRGDFSVSLKDDWRLSASNFYDLLQEAKLIISAESSTTVEALCCGVPVVLIGMLDRHTPCYFFEEDRGAMWETVYNEKELDAAITSLSLSLEKENKMADVGKKYLDYYFTKPDEAGFEVFLNHKQKSETL